MPKQAAQKGNGKGKPKGTPKIGLALAGALLLWPALTLASSAGRVDLQVRMLGYEEQRLANVLVILAIFFPADLGPPADPLQPVPPGVSGGWMQLALLVKRHGSDPDRLGPSGDPRPDGLLRRRRNPAG